MEEVQFKPLRQKHIEAFELHLERLTARSANAANLNVNSARNRGNLVRAAIAADWLDSPEAAHSGSLYNLNGVEIGEYDPKDPTLFDTALKVAEHWLFMTTPEKN